MKTSIKAEKAREDAPTPVVKQHLPRWLVMLIGRIERGERQLSIPQKRLLLLSFSLVAGAWFLHLAITGAISPESDYHQHKRPTPPHVFRMPPPQTLPTDSLNNKSLTMTSIPLSKIDLRKLLKLLPVAAFLLTLGFYHLFDYLRRAGAPAESPGKSAFNTELPGPKLEDRYKNKLDLYMEARQDSLRKLKEARRDSLLFPVEDAGLEIVSEPPQMPLVARRPIGSRDPNEQKMGKAMERLQLALSQQEAEPYPRSDASVAVPSTRPEPTDLARLEKLMEEATASPPEDAEIKRLDGMLDKILEIRQPGRNSRVAESLSVDTLPAFIASADGPKPSEPTGNGFYGMTEDPAAPGTDESPGNGTISAVVHADQRVRTGSIVRLRLLQDMYINNARIPANSFVFGRATVAKERVELDIRYAVHANTVLPVKLVAFDIDGIAGIAAPGADARDVSRDGLNQAVQNLELYSMDPSLGAQAAASGIQAAKSLLSKKTKTPYAMLKADHKVMLVNSRF